MPGIDVIKKSDKRKQDEISQEIQEIIKNYKEPDMTLFMSHPETKTIEIPFVKKSQSELPKIKLTYFNTSTKKNEDFLIYDFIGHLEKFGFEWIQTELGLKYEVKIDSSDDKKLQKKLTLSKSSRKKICLDESRIWNMESSWKLNESGNKRISYLIGYLENETLLKSMIGITGSSYDFTSMSAEVKCGYLRRLTRHIHYGKPNIKNSDYFYSGLAPSYAVLLHVLDPTIIRFTDRLKKLFVPKFYHDRKDTNFLKGLLYVREKKEIDERNFFEGLLLGRKLYEYRINGSDNGPVSFNTKDLDWPFPEIYYQSIGFTVDGFSFEFKNADNNLSAILNPEDDLINVESGTEIADNNLTEGLFFSKKDTIENKIAEFNAIPIKNLINESFFLYDKVTLSKRHLSRPSAKNYRSTGHSAIFQVKHP